MIVEERRSSVVVLTLDRPERRNAIDGPGCEELAAAVERASHDASRVIVLTGAGGHFCAGADLAGVNHEKFAAAVRNMLEAIVACPTPVIAAVEGVALGAGTQLAVACDLRVAQPDARFGIPAAKLGLAVDHWTVQRLVQLAGMGTAQAMLLAAEEVDGSRAFQLGLVQRLGSLTDACGWADHIAALAPLTTAAHKLALNRLEPVLADAEVERAWRRAWTSTDLAEGMAAFRERRPPRFRGC